MSAYIRFIVFFAYAVGDSSCLKGLRVCGDPVSKREYCCSGYEDMNGICIKCKNGFKSIQGQSCMPCEKDRFGERCLGRCKCISFERCDNVKGCVPEVGTFNTTAANDNVTYIFIDNSMKTTTEFSKDHLLIYSLVATSIIFTVGTCFVCRRLQKRKARREVTTNETTSPLSQITNYGNKTYLSTEGNSLMNNTFTKKSIGPFIATEEPNPPEKDDTDNDEDSNLHPYNSILKQESNSVTDDRTQKPFQTFRESLTESTENITTHLDYHTGD